MKKNDFLSDLTIREIKNISGGYAPPTQEQLDRLREIYGPAADFICW
ncbi:hypothetical protein [Bacteroides sp. 51]|nr:hypothetical protein [Bacteroides sp. 51]